VHTTNACLLCCAACAAQGLIFAGQQTQNKMSYCMITNCSYTICTRPVDANPDQKA